MSAAFDMPVASDRLSDDINDSAPRLKGRQRLAQRLSGMSSSTSLSQIGRSRASSSPMRNSGQNHNNTSRLSLLDSNASTHTASSARQESSSLPPSPPSDPYFDGFRARLVASSRSDLPAALRMRAQTYANGQHVPKGTYSQLRQEFDPMEFEDDYFSRPIVHSRLDEQRSVYTPPIRTPAPRRTEPFQFFDDLPHEITVSIFALLTPKELIRASRVSKQFRAFCYDGQLWSSVDASEFYRDIPAESLTHIIKGAGPFVKHLNLRGCVQVEYYQRADIVAESCKNLVTATLEGCRNFRRQTLHKLLTGNDRLAHVNLTGLVAVNNHTCKVVARNCPQLESLNVSWCTHMDARGIKTILAGCPKLRDLRASEVKGFDSEVAEMIFKAEYMERLVLSGCVDIDDEILQIMMHGIDPEIDILEDRPIVPPRKLRQLDMSRNPSITDKGIKALAYNVPELQGLQLSGLSLLTDDAFVALLPTIPFLTHLDLEEVHLISNELLSEHLAKAPFAPSLEHLSLSYCENLTDAGVIPLIRTCTKLRSVDFDNTRISDAALTEAARMVRSRSMMNSDLKNSSRPVVSLKMFVFDCPNVTSAGIRDVLHRNAKVRTHTQPGAPSRQIYPSEIIELKCFYGFQQTVEAHTNRLLAGQFGAANKLEAAWGEWLLAQEEAETAGAGGRRRRRRAREAAHAHAAEAAGGAVGRRRARSGPCAVM